METMQSYLERKHRELALLGSCLASALDLKRPDSVAAVIEQKFRLAGALKAQRLSNAWAVTETARDSAHRSRSGGFEFTYGYQRADLSVRGPPVYAALAAPNRLDLHETLYTGSGMSAMAAVLTTLRRVCSVPELLLPQGCYSETVELIESFGDQLRVLPIDGRHPRTRGTSRATRIILLDSSVRSASFPSAETLADEVDLVLFDSTCFWKNSTRIRRVIDWALQSGVPLALLRSHAKLDCLGVEYGRLGSVVFAARLGDASKERATWIRQLVDQTRESVRLFGMAPVPAHFPPFTASDAYERCSIARVAAIIRSTRRMTRGIVAALGDGRCVSAFQHGLYLTLSPAADLGMDEVRDLAGNLSAELESMGLPVRHAGSFGFDFVAIEWYHGSASSKNMIRIAASDLPSPLSDRIAQGIAKWWSARGMSSPGRSTRGNAEDMPRHANVS